MTVRLTRLRIAGFKSFADPATLEILPGLTGVVGPNGCGKSNVVEALRWAMGESSARSLRGGEMDDVIFAGTVARASRNLAEVSITLEPSPETPLPQPFEAEAELCVTRRIERGAGSGFRANGREMRARDVQTLYADLASGARSSGMVSQGRVAALVGARPEDRRQVLEEAAGISGLHARRHEAELKLRAAEQNLARAEDLRTQLDATRDGLRRQARQASRYRSISGHVAEAEAEFLGVLHAREQAAAAAAQAACEAAGRKAADAEARLHAAQAALVTAEAALAEPVAAETASRTMLERRRLEAESLAGEAEQALRASAEAAARTRDIAADREEARLALHDAAANLQRIDTERLRLQERGSALPGLIEAASGLAEGAAAALTAAELEAESSASRAAEAAAEQRHATLALEQARARVAAAESRLGTVQADRAGVQAQLPSDEALHEAEGAVVVAQQAVETARAGLLVAETSRGEAVARYEAARLGREALVRDAAAATAARDDAELHAGRMARALEAAQAVWHEHGGRIVDPSRLEEAADEAAMAASSGAASEADVDHAEDRSRELADRAAAAARDAADLASLHGRAQASCAAADEALRRRTAEHAALAGELEACGDGHAETVRLRAAEADLDAVRIALDAACLALDRQAADRLQADAARAAARADAADRAADLSRWTAEAEGLRASLQGMDGEHPGALDEMRVPAGLEAALGAALGAAGEASLDPEAHTFWRELLPLPAQEAAAGPLGGCATLSGLVDAPAAMARALSWALLLEDGADGSSVQAALRPGQVAVDRAGAAWRWDGYVSRAGTPNRAAARLLQRNRIEAAELARERARSGASHAAGLLAEADVAAAEAMRREQAAREARDAGEQALRAAQAAQGEAAAAAAQSAARLGSLGPALTRSAASRSEASRQQEDAARALASLSPLGEANAEAARFAGEAREAAERLAAALEARRRARECHASASARLLGLQQEAAEAERERAALAPLLERAEAADLVAREALRDAVSLQQTLAARLAEEQAFAESGEAAEAASGRVREAAAARAEMEAGLDAARLLASTLEAAAIRARNRLADLDALLDAVVEEHGAASSTLVAAQARVAACAGATGLADLAASSRNRLTEARAGQMRDAASLRMLEAEAARLDEAVAAVEAELAGWRVRSTDAERRCTVLESREAQAVRDGGLLDAARDDLDRRLASSGDMLAQAVSAHEGDAQTLRAREVALREATLAEREAQLGLGDAREALVRAQGALEAAAAGLRAILARAADRLGSGAALPVAPDSSVAAEERARRKLDRLTRERDEMGPVNLRAEAEVEELDQRILGIEQDRTELETAIARLRGAIGHLNREGRARLVAVFEQVDRHFRTLFTRMMGGGRAHLAWLGSDDPLLAGLDIYAEPPGKKLVALSLLSGGEQALTALSLIFAVFRCTPAPVCVLDEVDAPLDDANVERFCALLEDVVRETGTRFLVVTHHQLTMSRMDRLFGVTMQERGVSRVLSVDLRSAAELVGEVRELRAAE